MYSKRREPPSLSRERRPGGAALAPALDGRPLAVGAPAEEAELEALAPRLALAFAPLHKRALGIAFGTASGLLVLTLTVVHLLVVRPRHAPSLYLLDQYFYGYSISWPGALIGAWWGFFTGFVAGWFLAFARNFALALSLFVTRTRAELQETREFLDHI